MTGDDMLEFRLWWTKRMSAGEVGANTGNKDLIHIGDVLKTVNKMKRLGLLLPLSDLSFKKGEPGKRPPFTTKWIVEKLLADEALSGLNDQARGIFPAMVNTGARLSELAGLTKECIRLNVAVPHISIEPIEPIGRQLKSANARRVIPLCGVSFVALKEFSDGFPRYRKSSASLSATLNKFLRSNDLLER